VSIEIVLARNTHNADRLSKQDLGLVPRLRTVVLTCADHRVDPAHVLGLDLGDAVVLRNPGGRVTPEIIAGLVLLGTVAAVENINPGFDIIVMHHTDCGLSRLTEPEHGQMLADFAGVAPENVGELHVDDPVLSVRYDVGRLAALGLGSDLSRFVGVVFDVATGLVRQHAG
jgi:carbonic anhydrase